MTRPHGPTLRGKATKENSRLKNCLKNVWKKQKCLRNVSLLTNLMAPEEKMKLAMKSEGAGHCDLDEMDVADSMAIK